MLLIIIWSLRLNNAAPEAKFSSSDADVAVEEERPEDWLVLVEDAASWLEDAAVEELAKAGLEETELLSLGAEGAEELGSSGAIEEAEEAGNDSAPTSKGTAGYNVPSAVVSGEGIVVFWFVSPAAKAGTDRDKKRSADERIEIQVKNGFFIKSSSWHNAF